MLSGDDPDDAVGSWPQRPMASGATVRSSGAEGSLVLGTMVTSVRFPPPTPACHPERRCVAPEPKDLWRSGQAIPHPRDPSTPRPSGVPLRMTMGVGAWRRALVATSRPPIRLRGCGDAIRCRRGIGSRQASDPSTPVLRTFAAMNLQRKPPPGRRDGRWGSTRGGVGARHDASG